MNPRVHVKHDATLPWWRRRWRAAVGNTPYSRGFTRRGTIRMARRARRWTP